MWFQSDHSSSTTLYCFATCHNISPVLLKIYVARNYLQPFPGVFLASVTKVCAQLFTVQYILFSQMLPCVSILFCCTYMCPNSKICGKFRFQTYLHVYLYHFYTCLASRSICTEAQMYFQRRPTIFGIWFIFQQSAQFLIDLTSSVNIVRYTNFKYNHCYKFCISTRVEFSVLYPRY